MPRKKMPYLPGRETARPNCFAFYVDRGGRPACRALRDVYCLKEKRSCTFRATPESAAEARKRAWRRLMALGHPCG
ncbi:hypothetical protein AAFA46_05750 [Oscillospiraceae bacterium WX1]